MIDFLYRSRSASKSQTMFSNLPSERRGHSPETYQNAPNGKQSHLFSCRASRSLEEFLSREPASYALSKQVTRLPSWARRPRGSRRPSGADSGPAGTRAPRSDSGSQERRHQPESLSHKHTHLTYTLSRFLLHSTTHLDLMLVWRSAQCAGRQRGLEDGKMRRLQIWAN